MILREFENLFNKNKNFDGIIKHGEKLSSHTTMNVGGKAKLFFEVNSVSSFVFFLEQALKNNMNFFVLGGGSNTIFNDEGIDIALSTRKLNSIKKETESSIKVECGTSWAKVINFCKNENLGGIESFCGLSGTVGGAVFMNATCFSLSVSDILQKVTFFDTKDFLVKEYKFNSSDWSYKSSPFNKNFSLTEKLFPDKIILDSTFKIKENFDSFKAEEVLNKRKEMGHFNYPSSGSAFKNKPEESIIAGKLIDECGLKGKIIGNAQIAPYHANFFINPEKKATFKDFLQLKELVEKTVFEQKNIKLEPEIIFV